MSPGAPSSAAKKVTSDEPASIIGSHRVPEPTTTSIVPMQKYGTMNNAIH